MPLARHPHPQLPVNNIQKLLDKRINGKTVNRKAVTKFYEKETK